MDSRDDRKYTPEPRPDARVEGTDRLEPQERDTMEKAAGPVTAAGGALATGAAGTLVLGPIGTAIGAIAGAIGGWWAGTAASHDVGYTEDDETYYRKHFESGGGTPTDVRYESVRPAYQIGHVAARNPDYSTRSFDDIEPDLRRGWTDELAREYGPWESVRAYARSAFERRRTGEVAQSPHTLDMGGTGSHQRASYSDPAAGYPDREIGTSGPRVEGQDRVQSTGEPEWMRDPMDRGGFGIRRDGLDDDRPDAGGASRG